MSIVYLNGEWMQAAEARISPEDRGFLLGDGVFDTLRSYDGVFFRFEDHAARLFRGLEEVRIEAPFDQAGLLNILTEMHSLNGEKDLVVRVTITRGMGEGGYRWKSGTRPTVYASARDVPDVAKIRAEGLALSVSPVPRPLPFLSVVKTTSIGAMALARVLAETDEVIMLDANGHVAEGAASTLYAIRGERILTPPSLHVLPATTRRVIEELFAVEERVMTSDEFLASDALFLSATSMGPVPVRAVADHRYPVRHPLMDGIYGAFDGAIARYWAHPA
ncbi:MAG: aminotransferase class IV [Candidatus Hydrogenedentota bacterium]